MTSRNNPLRRLVAAFCVALAAAVVLATATTREVHGMAAISSVALTTDANGDAVLTFVTGWDNQTRTVSKTDVPAGVNTVAEVENWFNTVYFPSILFNPETGAMRGFAKIHITKLSPLTYVSIFSTQPIPANWP